MQSARFGDKSKLLETTKKNVRSVLLSSNLPMSLRDVMHEYYFFFNDSIPAAQLGYRSAEALLEDLSDVVQPVTVRGDIFYCVVADEKTRDIAELQVNTRPRNVNPRAAARVSKACEAARIATVIQNKKGPESKNVPENKKIPSLLSLSVQQGRPPRLMKNYPSQVQPPRMTKIDASPVQPERPQKVTQNCASPVVPPVSHVSRPKRPFGKPAQSAQEMAVKQNLETSGAVASEISNKHDSSNCSVASIKSANSSEQKYKETSKNSGGPDVSRKSNELKAESTEKYSNAGSVGGLICQKNKSSALDTLSSDHYTLPTDRPVSADNSNNLVSSDSKSRPHSRSYISPSKETYVTCTTNAASSDTDGDYITASQLCASDYLSMDGVYADPLSSSYCCRPMSAANLTVLRGEIKGLMLAYPTGLRIADFPNAYAKYFGRHLDLQKTGFSTFVELLRSMPDVVDLEVIDSSSTDGSKTLSYVVCGKYHAKQIKTELSGEFGVVLPSMAPQRPSQEASTNKDNNDLSILKGHIKQILQKHPDGLFASKLPAEYKKHTERELPLQNFGFTVMNLIAELGNSVVSERPTSLGDWLLFDSELHQLRYSSTELKRDPNQWHLDSPESIKSFVESLKTVVGKSVDGIPVQDLQSVLENATGKKLNIKDLGFRTMDSFIRTFEPLKNIAQPQYAGRGNYKVTLVEVERGAVEKSSSIGRGSLPLSPEELALRDSIEPGREYLLEEPPVPQSDYIPVRVSSIVDPGQFWLQQAAKEPALDRVMNDMQFFYESALGMTYQLPDSMLRVGQVCVARYHEQNEWHRCTIIMLHNNTAKLYYVDYGSFGTVPRNSLRLLSNRFFSLPAQAIRARLAHIAPVAENWTQASYKRFMQMAEEKCLLALVVHYNESTETLSVMLCDTTGEVDIHINDTLMVEGHAVHRADCYSSQSFTTLSTVATHGPVEAVDANSCAATVGLSAAATAITTVTAAATAEVISTHVYSHHSPVPIRSATNVIPPNHNGVSHNQFLASLSTVAPDPPSDSLDDSPNSRSSPELVLGEMSYSVKLIALTREHGAHLVRIGEKLYMTSLEISLLLWDSDCLGIKLRLKGRSSDFNPFMLMKYHLPSLFNELIRLDIAGSQAAVGGADSFVMLYELASVVQILELFAHPSEDLKLSIQHQVDMFNPRDPCWMLTQDTEDLVRSASVAATTADDDDDVYHSESTDEIVVESINSLTSFLENLNMQRNELLESLKEPTVDSVACVDELMKVETEKKRVSDRIHALKKKQAGQGDSKSVVSSTVSKADSITGLTCASTFKPVSVKGVSNESVSISRSLLTNTVSPMVISTTTVAQASAGNSRAAVSAALLSSHAPSACANTLSVASTSHQSRPISPLNVNAAEFSVPISTLSATTVVNPSTTVSPATIVTADECIYSAAVLSSDFRTASGLSSVQGTVAGYQGIIGLPIQQTMGLIGQSGFAGYRLNDLQNAAALGLTGPQAAGLGLIGQPIGLTGRSILGLTGQTSAGLALVDQQTALLGLAQRQAASHASILNAAGQPTLGVVGLSNASLRGLGGQNAVFGLHYPQIYTETPVQALLGQQYSSLAFIRPVQSSGFVGLAGANSSGVIGLNATYDPMSLSALQQNALQQNALLAGRRSLQSAGLPTASVAHIVGYVGGGDHSFIMRSNAAAIAPAAVSLGAVTVHAASILGANPPTQRN